MMAKGVKRRDRAAREEARQRTGWRLRRLGVKMEGGTHHHQLAVGIHQPAGAIRRTVEVRQRAAGKTRQLAAIPIDQLPRTAVGNSQLEEGILPMEAGTFQREGEVPLRAEARQLEGKRELALEVIYLHQR